MSGLLGKKSGKSVARGHIGCTAILVVLCLSSLPAQTKEVVLVGPLTKEKILKAVPAWTPEIAAYAPKLDVIDKLRFLPRPVHIRVFLATWCPDCKKHVSAFFRVVELADNPSISVEYIGVSKDKKEPEGPIKENRIVRVPTFIVIINGEEKGRVVENPRTSIEEDLAAIIRQARENEEEEFLDIDYFRNHPHSHLTIDCAKCHITAPVRK